MALTERLAILIDVNGAAAVDEFSKVSKAANALSSQMTKIGAAAATIGGGLVAASAGDVRALAQLKASVSAAGDSYSEYEDAIDKAVDKNLKFAIASEDTNAGLQKLVEATGSTSKALQYIGVATDLAASKHIGLAEASDQVAKILNGKGARALASYGVVVKENADGTKDYAGAVDDLGDKLDGQAAASVTGFAGKLRVLHTEVEEGVQQFGAKYGPAISAAGFAFIAAGQGLGVLNAIQAKRTAGLVAETAALEADTAAQVENTAAKGAAAGVGGAGLLSGLGTIASAAAPIVGAAAAIIATGAAVDHFINKTGEAHDTVVKLAHATDDDLVPAFEHASKAFGPGGTGNLNLFKQIAGENATVAYRLRDALAAAGYDVSKFDKVLATSSATASRTSTNVGRLASDFEHFPPVVEAATNGIRGFGGGLVDLAHQIDLVGAGFATKFAKLDLDEQFSTLISGSSKAGHAMRDYASDQHQLETATRSITAAQNDLADAELALFLARLGPSQDEVASAALSRDDAAQALKDANRAVIEAERDLKDARQGGDRDDVADAESRLANARLAQRHALQNNTAAQKDYTETLNSGAESSDKVKAAQDRLVEAQDRVTDAQYNLTQSTKTAASAVDDFTGSTEDFARGSISYIQSLIDSGDSTDDIVSATENAISRVDDLAKKYGNELNPKLAAYRDLLQEILATELLSKLAAGDQLSREEMDKVLKTGVIVPTTPPISGPMDLAPKAPYNLSAPIGLMNATSGGTGVINIPVQINGREVALAVVDYSWDAGGLNLLTRSPH